MTRRIGYIRVSDQDQTLDLQADALKSAGCDAIYSDHGISGYKVHRQGLDQVLKRLEDGDTLIVWKLDRLSRSTVQLLLLLDDLHKRGIDFVSLTQGIDTRTALGRFLYGQLAVFAEFEREQISERTKAGMQAAKARGKHVGRPTKLNAQQKAEIRASKASGEMTIKQLCAAYQVSKSTVLRINR